MATDALRTIPGTIQSAISASDHRSFDQLAQKRKSKFDRGKPKNIDTS